MIADIKVKERLIKLKRGRRIYTPLKYFKGLKTLKQVDEPNPLCPSPEPEAPFRKLQKPQRLRCCLLAQVQYPMDYV